MPEPLKNQFGPEIPHRIAAQLAAVSPQFPAEPFLADVLHGYDALELMPRARNIAGALRRHLPGGFEEAVELLLATLGPKLERDMGNGMAPFFYLPHVLFVADHGLDHFEASMRAQYELTQRFTAEFSIRAFIERYPEATLARLRQWAADPSHHVRRLVSEGTRPRLPWAQRLRAFQQDPAPVLALLELLKDDPSLYVRRSVANNLNDIGKDHPEILYATAERWLQDADDHRRWVVEHALRSAVKRAEPGALRVLGYGKSAAVTLHNAAIDPPRPRIGESVTIRFELRNVERRVQSLLVDFQVHYVKANGRTNPKVFKLKTLELAAGESARFSKKVALVPMTTRQHYPGEHRVEVMVNGQPLALGSFELLAAAR